MTRPALKAVETVMPEAAPLSEPAMVAAVPTPAPEAARTVVPFGERAREWGAEMLRSTVPPLITLLLILLVWEILCSGKGATLPPPSTVWKEASDLILDPFFVNGSQDIGLGWRVLTSLQRVAVGFGLAAIVGVLVGALVGQSTWAMRGLDPISRCCAPCRRSPGCRFRSPPSATPIPPRSS